MNKKVQTVIIILVILLMCFADNLFSQVYTGIGIGNKGANYEVGVLAGSIDLKANYTMPITSNENKKILSINIGKQFLVNEKITVLPSFGYGFLKWQDFTEYDKGGEIINMQDYKPIVSLQTGLEGRAGNVYVFTSYCSKYLVYGIGFKVFYSKL